MSSSRKCDPPAQKLRPTETELAESPPPHALLFTVTVEFCYFSLSETNVEHNVKDTSLQVKL